MKFMYGGINNNFKNSNLSTRQFRSFQKAGADSVHIVGRFLFLKSPSLYLSEKYGIRQEDVFVLFKHKMWNFFTSVAKPIK